MELLTKRMNEQLDILVGKSFAINRMLDRGMSLLTVRWKLIRFAEILHPNVAHAYLGDKFADGISEYQSLRDCETTYPATPIGNAEYDVPIDFFKDYLKQNLEFEEMIKDAIEVACEEDDITTKQFLERLLNKLSKYTALSLDLVDLVSNCNTAFELMMLDSVIKKYVKVRG